MRSTLQQKALFAMYQLTVVLGIALFPLAMLAKRAGVSLPLGRAVETLGNAYENASQ